MAKSNIKITGGKKRRELTARKKEIYMDWAASAEPNPSSMHALGTAALALLSRARDETAEILSAGPEEVIFTGGGTEGNNLAIQGTVWHFLEKKEKGKISGNSKQGIPHVVTTNIEHPSVLETVKMLERRGLAKATIIPAEADGFIDPKKVRKAINKDTVLVSVMYVNNEIGTIEPIREITKEIRHWRKASGSLLPYFHTDAVQAVNYLSLNTAKLGVDMLTISGSKISGSPKVGVLFKRHTVPLSPVFAGGNQEFGLRPGTENLDGILKFTKALKASREKALMEAKRLAKLRDALLSEIKKYTKDILGTDVIINGKLENRLPNNLNVTFPGIPSDLLVIELSERGVMISEKSACKSGDKKASHVIMAIRGVQTEEKNRKKDGAPGYGTGSFPRARDSTGSLRFSLGPDISIADVRYSAKMLKEILRKLKSWYV